MEISVVGFVVSMNSIVVERVDKLKFGFVDKVSKEGSVSIFYGRRVMEVTC